MIYVEYEEPWFGEIPRPDGSLECIACTVRILKDDVIRWQRHREPRYESDEEALDDFLVVHWARLVEYDK